MKKFAKKSITFALILSLALGTAGMLGVNLSNAATTYSTTMDGSGQYVYESVADNATNTVPAEFGSEDANGRVWTDKTVKVNSKFNGIDTSYNITLSALAQEYKYQASETDLSKEPADVLMILDFTGSMYKNYVSIDEEYALSENDAEFTFANDPQSRTFATKEDANKARLKVAKTTYVSAKFGDEDDNEPDKLFASRIDATIIAVNKAMDIIMSANPDNRIEIDCYNTACTCFAPLASYKAGDNGTYVAFEYTSNKDTTYMVSAAGLKAKSDDGTYIGVDNLKSRAVSGNTYTQYGIAQACDHFLNTSLASSTNTNFGGQDRTPFVLFMTDGHSLLSSEDWYNNPPSDSTNYYKAEEKEDRPDKEKGLRDSNDYAVSALTVLTAAYQKKLIQEKYATLNEDSEDDKTEVHWFNIGIGVEPIEGIEDAKCFQLMLDPSKIGTTSKIYTKYLEKYLNLNPGYISPTDIAYCDSGCVSFVDTPNTIKAAFNSLGDIVADSSGSVVLPITSTEIGGGVFITFADTLGTGTSLATATDGTYDLSITLEGIKYKTLPDATDTNLYHFYSDASRMTGELESNVTIDEVNNKIIWRIDADELPIIKFANRATPGDLVNDKMYISADPIELSYNVVLTSAGADIIYAKEKDETANNKVYSNAFDSSTNADLGSTTAVFTPKEENSYYYGSDKATKTELAVEKASNGNPTSTAKTSSSYTWDGKDYVVSLGNNGRAQGIAKIEIAADKESYKPGDTVVYTVTATNLSDGNIKGDSNQSRSLMRIYLPECVDLVSEVGVSQSSDGTNRYAYLNLQSGKSKTYTVTAKINGENSSDSAAKATIDRVNTAKSINLAHPAADTADIDVEYTLNYDLQGGSFAESVATSTNYTAKDSLTLATPTFLGYTFAGWKVETSSGSWTANDVFGPEELERGKGNYGNVTLVAQWNVEYKYISKGNGKVQLGSNTATSTDSEIINAINGTATNVTAIPDPGYQFDGWYSDEDCTDSVGTGTDYTPSKTLVSGTDMYTGGTYYAKFSSLLSIEKTAKTATSTVLPGDKITYTIKVTNTGNSTLTDIIVRDTLPTGLKVTRWSDNYSNVDRINESYDYKIYTLGVGASEAFSYEVTVPDNQSASSYTNIAKVTSFVSGAATITDFNPEASATTSITDYVKVTYKFVDKPVEVDDSNGQNSLLPATDYVATGTSYISKKTGRKPTNPIECAGYVFDGWYTDSSCTPDKKYTDGTTLSANQDLYGKWYPLEISKAVATPTALSGSTPEQTAGGDISYTITVKNDSNVTATNLTVTDALDTSSLTFTSADNGGTFATATNIVTWTGVEVGAKSTKKLTVTVTTKADITTATNVKNKAVLTDKKSAATDSNIVEAKINPRAFEVEYKFVTNTDHPEIPTTAGGTEIAAPSKSTGVIYGSAYTSTTPTDVAGWKFDGWYTTNTDLTVSNKWTEGTPITKNTTLYGQWSYVVSISKALATPTATGGNIPEVDAGGELGSVEYTITITNPTALPLTGYSVTDKIDANITGVTLTATPTSAGQMLTYTNNTVRATGLTVPANGSITITIKGKVKDDLLPTTAEKDYKTDIKNIATGTDSLGKELTTGEVEFKAVPQSFGITYEFVTNTNHPNIPKNATGTEIAPPTDSTKYFYGTETDIASPSDVAGWKFDGWYRTKDATTGELSGKVDADKIEMTDDVTLYGQWTYAVSIDKKLTSPADTDIVGGSNLTYTITVKNESEVDITAADNYTVTDILEGNLEYLETPGASLSTGTDVSGTIEYYATTTTLTVKNLTVTGNGGVAVITVPVKVKSTITASTTNVSNTAEGIQGADKNTEKSSKVTTNVGPKSITIDYEYVNCDGASNPTSATKPGQVTGKKYGDSFTVAANSTSTLSPDDQKWYSFDGWYKNYDAGTFTDLVTGSQILNSDTFPELATGTSIKLYGKWTPKYELKVEKDVLFGDPAASVADGNIDEGSTITYCVTVTNMNPVETTTATIVDEVPTGLVVQAGTIDNGGSFATDSNIITWADQMIYAGASLTLKFNASVGDIDAVQTYLNKAYVNTVKLDGTDTAYEDPFETKVKGEKNNPAEVSFYGIPTKTVKVAKEWSDTWDSHATDTVLVYMYKQVGAGEKEKFKEITLTKDKQTESFIVQAKTTAGEEISYSFAEIFAAKALAEGEMYGKYKVSYVTKTNIEPGTGKLISEDTTIKNIYQFGPDDFTLGKKTEAIEEDVPIPTETPTVTPTPEASPTVEPTPGPEVPEADSGESFYYVITIKNNRTHETANNLVIEDVVPEGLTIIGEPEASNGSVTADEENENKLTWTIEKIAPGEKLTLKIKVHVPENAEAEKYVNAAELKKIGDTSYTSDNKTPEATTKLRNFTVSKTWVGKDGNTVSGEALSGMPAVEVTLYQTKADGSSAALVREDATVSLSKENDWTYKWRKLPLTYTEGGSEYAYNYSVQEKALEDYQTAYNYAQTGKSVDFGNTTGAITNSARKITVIYEFKGSAPGGVVPPASEEVAYGQKYTAADKMSAAGYSFDGWFMDEACTTRFVDGTVLDESNTKDGVLVLYGVWSVITRVVHYDANGGVEAPADQYMNYFTETKVSEITPVKENAVFLGWSKDSKAKAPDPKYAPGELIKKAYSYDGLENLTLYAVWGINVSYQYVGDIPDDVTPPDSEVVEMGANYNAAPKSSKIGYTFDGWFLDSECTIRYVDGTELNENTILYGKWTKNPAPKEKVKKIIKKLKKGVQTGDANALILYSLIALAALIMSAKMLKHRKRMR